jgi:hypothetical protein
MNNNWSKVIRFKLFLQGSYSVMTVMLLELFPTQQRTFAGMCIGFFWILGLTTLTGFAYYIRDWRMLLIALLIPQAVSVFFYW